MIQWHPKAVTSTDLYVANNDLYIANLMNALTYFIYSTGIMKIGRLVYSFLSCNTNSEIVKMIKCHNEATVYLSIIIL